MMDKSGSRDAHSDEEVPNPALRQVACTAHLCKPVLAPEQGQPVPIHK